MKVDALIFDRTIDDVNYAIENQNSLEHLKGAYNFVDLNRIESNCKYVENVLNNTDVFNLSINLEIKTDWKITDVPTLNDINRIRQNVKTLIDSIESPHNFEEIEFSNNMDYIKANILEKDLHLIKTYSETFDRVIKNCNTFYSGLFGLHGEKSENEGPLILHQSCGLLKCGSSGIYAKEMR